MSGAFLAKVYYNWRSRHRHPVTFTLHLVGIPACFLAAPALLIARQFLVAAACFVGGYLLQFVGHLMEGNRPGEVVLMGRLLGRFRREGGGGDVAQAGECPQPDPGHLGKNVSDA